MTSVETLMQAEIERLREQNASQSVHIIAQGGEIEGLREDAARYRYLRHISRQECLVLDGPEAGVWCDCENEHGDLVLLTEGDLDAAIDAALAARKGEAKRPPPSPFPRS